MYRISARRGLETVNKVRAIEGVSRDREKEMGYGRNSVVVYSGNSQLAVWNTKETQRKESCSECGYREYAYSERRQ
jgi:hypothetical protein